MVELFDWLNNFVGKIQTDPTDGQKGSILLFSSKWNSFEIVIQSKKKQFECKRAKVNLSTQTHMPIVFDCSK